MKTISILFLSILLFQNGHAQFENEFFEAIDEDFQVGGDIFSDFNEDLDSAQVMEDERFYRYGRFVTFNIGLGYTTFFGNRGLAYDDNSLINDPSFHLSITYFNNFQTSFLLGLEFSKHIAIIDGFTNGHKEIPVGAIETTFFRPFFGFKYYLDTSNLGTAITYSNPHLIGRVEYWYQTNKFPNNPQLDKESGGGIGSGVGFGLEFPMEIRKTYIGVEFLYHMVNFFDKDSLDYAEFPDDEASEQTDENGDGTGVFNTSEGGFDDLNGGSLSIMVTVNFNW